MNSEIPFPVLTWAVAFAFVMGGAGVLLVCHAVAERIKHGKSPKWAPKVPPWD